MHERGAVRPLGTPPPRSSRPPPRRAGLALAGLLGALLFTMLAGDPAIESDRSANTTPALPPEPAVTQPAAPLPAEPIPSPLDDLVPGFRGTLVMTVAAAEGIEVWRWSSGPEGVIARSLPAADLYDARPDPSGSWVAAVYRFGRELPSLQVGIEGDPTLVFWGTQSFAWHAATPGLIAWAEQRTAGTTTTIHTGERVAGGVFFRPAATLEGFQFATGADRLVAYDGSGFLVERWTGNRVPSVHRIGIDGTPQGEVPGQFVGISATGTVAVADGPATRLHTGPNLEMSAVIAAPYTSVVWAPDDARYAAAHLEGDSVDVADGAARRTVAVGSITPRVMSWSPDGRLVLVSGEIGSDPVIVFVDSITLDTRTVLLDVHPLAARVIP